MTDRDVKEHVGLALEWEPSVDATDIGVSAADGVVTLRGNVASYSEKVAAERAALRTFGVKAVANDLAVRIPNVFARTDTEVARAAVDALTWTTLVPPDSVTVTVANGWVTIRGMVEWFYQKSAAARAVQDLRGVKGVINDVNVRPKVQVADVRDKIEQAFKRSAQLDARRVNVNTSEGKVILSGNVHTWAERVEAERAAWSAPGVIQVDDRLAVIP